MSWNGLTSEKHDCSIRLSFLELNSILVHANVLFIFQSQVCASTGITMGLKGGDKYLPPHCYARKRRSHK